MINKTNAPELLKKLYPLEEDLIFFYGDLRVYSRNEIFRMIANKFQVLKNPQLIAVYLETLIRYQGEKYSLINKEEPAKSLYLFFEDLRKAVLKIPPDKINTSDHWGMVTTAEVLYYLMSSAHYFANGTYLDEDDLQPKLDGMVQHYISLLSGKDEIKQKQLSSGRTEIKEINPVFYKIPEVAKILNCCKDTVYKKHINILGLKTVKVEGDFMKVAKEDLEEHIERIRTNSVAKKQP